VRPLALAAGPFELGWQLAQQRDGEDGIRWQCCHCGQQKFAYRPLEA